MNSEQRNNGNLDKFVAIIGCGLIGLIGLSFVVFSDSPLWAKACIGAYATVWVAGITLFYKGMINP